MASRFFASFLSKLSIISIDYTSLTFPFSNKIAGL